MNHQKLNESLSLLGYTVKWLDYGLLTQELLSEQLHAFRSGDDKNTEHYRYGAFRNYLRTKETLTDVEFANYTQVASSDQNQVMAGAALIDLFTKIRLSDDQFDKLIAHLKALGDWPENMINRHTLLRKLKQQKLTDALFRECFEKGDNVVQEYLVGIADREQLQVLALEGRTKKIRSMALEQLH